MLDKITKTSRLVAPHERVAQVPKHFQVLSCTINEGKWVGSTGSNKSSTWLWCKVDFTRSIYAAQMNAFHPTNQSILQAVASKKWATLKDTQCNDALRPWLAHLISQYLFVHLSAGHMSVAGRKPNTSQNRIYDISTCCHGSCHRPQYGQRPSSSVQPLQASSYLGLFSENFPIWPCSIANSWCYTKVDEMCMVQNAMHGHGNKVTTASWVTYVTCGYSISSRRCSLCPIWSWTRLEIWACG